MHGSSTLSLAETDPNLIDLAARSRQGSQSKCYNLGISLPPTRTLAGQKSAEKGKYVRPRECPVPTELTDMIWPNLRGEREQALKNLQSGKYKTEVATFDYLAYMEWGASIVFQDMAENMDNVCAFKFLLSEVTFKPAFFRMHSWNLIRMILS